MNISAIFITGIFVVTSAFAYSVKKGDSLSAISKDHYGQWDRWKEIWKSNESLIANPNLIYPGQKLTIDNSIPGNERLLIAAGDKNFKVIRNKGRSNEWRLLPEQRWERFVFKKSPEVDPDGFDRRSRVAKRVAEKTTPTVAVSSDRMAIEGEIVNARTEYGQIFLGEQVFIRPEEQLQVGTTYTISSGPQKIISKRDKRVGFAYDLAGKVKIIGVRDGLFIGTVISTQKPIFRHNLLIPEVKQLEFKKAQPAPNVIVASILTTDFLNSTMLGEQQLVILDVGTNEGVKPGMIFRNYLKKDPGTAEKITTKDYLIESELQVLDVKDQFSTAIIIQSRSILHADDLVLSLMDLKDFQKNTGMQTFIQDYDYTTPLDDLDQLDDSQGLGEKEDQELRQLEKVDPNAYQGAPELGNEAAPNDQVDKSVNAMPGTPSTAPAPEDATLDDSSLAPPAETTEPVEAPAETKATNPAMDNDLDAIPPSEPAKSSSSDGAVLDVPTSAVSDIPADLNLPVEPAASPTPTPKP